MPASCRLGHSTLFRSPTIVDQSPTRSRRHLASMAQSLSVRRYDTGCTFIEDNGRFQYSEQILCVYHEDARFPYRSQRRPSLLLTATIWYDATGLVLFTQLMSFLRNSGKSKKKNTLGTWFASPKADSVCGWPPFTSSQLIYLVQEHTCPGSQTWSVQ